MTSLSALTARAEAPSGVASPLRAGEPAASNPKKILLLEDDAGFREVIKLFLLESGYELVCVKNGLEGVQEVLAGDFAVILCDMMMPKLPGDLFFRAVQKMRPDLCQRFVFMTGYRDNPKVDDFIAKVGGSVLIKPFHVDDLLEMIAFIQVRMSVQTAA
jgi:CheY-like chemotaxis protein